jgi:hypothetical protein
MSVTDTAISNKVVSFDCSAEYFDALVEFAIVERCSVPAAAHAIIERELMFLDYLPVPVPPIAVEIESNNF